MATIADIKARRDAAQAAYNQVANTGTVAEVKAASDAVRDTRAELSAAITVGANPCPDCGTHPHGMEQPHNSDESVPEYEVGCPKCGWFMHTDGTPRDHGARGGLRPHHTVELWNEGPDAWRTKPREKFDDAEWAALKPRAAK
jgi:hypothetical protein